MTGDVINSNNSPPTIALQRLAIADEGLLVHSREHYHNIHEFYP